MFDHIGFEVSDLEKSRKFYELALAPLGITLNGHNIEACCHRPE